jgi:hypothetical protein
MRIIGFFQSILSVIANALATKSTFIAHCAEFHVATCYTIKTSYLLFHISQMSAKLTGSWILKLCNSRLDCMENLQYHSRKFQYLSAHYHQILNIMILFRVKISCYLANILYIMLHKYHHCISITSMQDPMHIVNNLEQFQWNHWSIDNPNTSTLYLCQHKWPMDLHCRYCWRVIWWHYRAIFIIPIKCFTLKVSWIVNMRSIGSHCIILIATN